MRLYFSSIIIFVLSLLCYIPTQAQGLVLEQFIVKSEAASVVVNWELLDESSINDFKLYRKIDAGAFKLVATIPANGSGRYSFLDDEIFKDESQVITYELQVMRNNRLHKFYTTLSHNPTAIQRTWGSIKSMFK